MKLLRVGTGVGLAICLFTWGTALEPLQARDAASVVLGEGEEAQPAVTGSPTPTPRSTPASMNGSMSTAPSLSARPTITTEVFKEIGLEARWESPSLMLVISLGDVRTCFVKGASGLRPRALKQMKELA